MNYEILNFECLKKYKIHTTTYNWLACYYYPRAKYGSISNI